MSDENHPLSPAAMREMAVRLIERAAEVEIENRRAETDGENIVHFDPTADRTSMRQSIAEEYPLHALATLAEGMYRQRQSRNALFDFKFSHEPAWDILLDLYIQRTAGRRVMTSSACIASNVPATTALRYIALLEKSALVKRYEDPSDSRVTFVEITQSAYRKMAEHLNDVYTAFSHASDAARASFSVVR